MLNHVLTSRTIESDVTESAAGERDLAAACGRADTTQTEFDCHQADELLLDAFTRARRRFRGAVVAINERTTITNTGASEILQAGDRRQLWESAQSSECCREVKEILIELANGVTVEGRCHPVYFDRCLVGVVLHLSVLPAATGGIMGSDSPEVAGPPSVPIPFGVDPALLSGWSDLTDSERSVAELVGRGLSNKQAGRQLYISRYTVDYHLRRIYRKLGIGSRVELARLLGEHYDSLAGRPLEDRIA